MAIEIVSFPTKHGGSFHCYGKIVTSRMLPARRPKIVNISAWTTAVTLAPVFGAGHPCGFCLVNGKTAQGKALPEPRPITQPEDPKVPHFETRAVSAFVVVHGARQLPSDRCWLTQHGMAMFAELRRPRWSDRNSGREWKSGEERIRMNCARHHGFLRVFLKFVRCCLPVVFNWYGSSCASQDLLQLYWLPQFTSSRGYFEWCLDLNL